MKFFHTADWHLGKIVQGVHMTEDQRYILKQFLEEVSIEQPDAVIIAGDLYDRAVPPTEAVHLLDETLEHIVMQLNIPVLAIAGNHDSPSRMDFGSKLMKSNGYHITGQYTDDISPVILQDEFGEVHFHLVPFTDPSVVRNVLEDETIHTHNDAMVATISQIKEHQSPNARHVFVGHAFVTPYGEQEQNTSESERSLSIGGAEYVDAHILESFDYAALGHLHQAHFVLHEHIQYSGSILKYSMSEAQHKKGFYIVEMDAEGSCSVEKRLLKPLRDIRIVEATIDELLTHEKNDDYVFVRLLDEAPVLSPMERIRTVYPNALHVERKNDFLAYIDEAGEQREQRSKMSDEDLFQSFYKEVKGKEPNQETEELFKEVMNELLQIDS